MSKKKDEEVVVDDQIDRVYDEINKEYGDGIITNVNNFLQVDKTIIPVSPALDIALCGGIPEGSWCTFTGKTGAGKTTLCLHIAAKAQRPEYGGRDVYYLDIEGRFKKLNVEGIPGLNKDKFYVITSKPEKILNAQDFLSIAEKIICSVPKAVIILDSVSALCTETEFNSGMEEMQRADGPKLLAKFCRKMAGRIPVHNTILLAVTHLMANPSGYGSPFQEKSGNAIAYQADVKIRAKHHKAWELTNTSKPTGQTISWVVEKGALGPPGGEAEGYIRYGQGVDELLELIVLGTQLGLINKAGAWYSCPFLSEFVADYDEKKFKFQGQEKLYDFFLKNPEHVKNLDQAFRKLVG